MADQLSREEQIVNAVLQLRTREERAAYLKGACAGDAALQHFAYAEAATQFDRALAALGICYQLDADVVRRSPGPGATGYSVANSGAASAALQSEKSATGKAYFRIDCFIG